METPLVSVVIPVYKVEKYLRRCLDSVKNQTYGNIEVVMVDDGSPDGCPAICEEYAAADPRFHAIHKANGGLSSARNAGLDWLEINRGGGGEYLYFVDSDDELHTDILEKCVAALRESGADAVIIGYCKKSVTDTEILGEDNRIPEPEIYNCDSRQAILDRPIRFAYGVPAEVLTSSQGEVASRYKRFITAWCTVYKRSIIADNHLRFCEDVRYSEDCLFLCDYLYRCEKVVSLPVIGYEYLVRYRDGTLSTLAYSPEGLDTKINLVKHRAEFRDRVLADTGTDISEWAYGSSVLSVFQICLAYAGIKRGWRQVKRYTSLPEVRKAVRAVPLKGKPKLVLPLALCKMGLYRLVYILISALKKIGISIKL